MNAKNGALTFAFTIAGACIGYALKDAAFLVLATVTIAGIGAVAAAFEEQ